MKISIISFFLLYLCIRADAQWNYPNTGNNDYLKPNEYTLLNNQEINIANGNSQKQNVYDLFNTVKPQLLNNDGYQKPQLLNNDRYPKPQLLNNDKYPKPEVIKKQPGINDEKYQKPQGIHDNNHQKQQEVNYVGSQGLNTQENNFQGFADDRFQTATKVQLLGPGTTEVEPLNNITFAITNFAVQLMKSIGSLQKGNVIISPTSVTTVLALLQQGTYGNSQQQITDALQLAPALTAPTYKRLTTDMQKRVSRNILTVANNIYLGEGFELNEAFKQTATKNFGSEVSLLNSHQPALAVRQINKWVASKTNNKILNLLTEDSVNPNTQLVIVNAVYFKGLWETQFKPDATKDMDFYLSNGKKTLVPFMRMTTDLKYGVDEDLDSCVVILPFERNQYSLIIILPNENANVNDALNSLTNTKLVNYHKLPENEVRIELPKFTLKSDTDLIPVLRKMGVSAIFDDESDLSGIGTYRTFSPHITSAVHTGFMSVDEQGVSASAASSFAGIALSFDPSIVNFEVNRPFVAVLWDTQFAIPLFIARIEEPRI